jgi:thymidylate synthase
MSEGFPLITSKKVYWKGVVAELLWFLNGRTDLRFLLERDCKIWVGDAYKKHLQRIDNEEYDYAPYCVTEEDFIHEILTNDSFSELNGDLGPIYGKAWRRWLNIRQIDGVVPNESWAIRDYTDQISLLVNELRNNPDSRRMLVSAWNPARLNEMTLPPCHYSFQVYTKELTLTEKADWLDKHYPLITSSWHNHGLNNLEYLEEVEFEYSMPKRSISLLFNMRSCDVGLGLPFNLASYGLLLSILGNIVNMIPDELICNIGDAHIYNNHKEGILQQISRDPFNLPKLKINSENWNLTTTADIISSFSMKDFQLEGYQSHRTVSLPLST